MPDATMSSEPHPTRLNPPQAGVMGAQSRARRNQCPGGSKGVSIAIVISQS